MRTLSRAFAALGILAMCLFPVRANGQGNSPAERGVPPVAVTHAGKNWSIAGKYATVTLDGDDLSLAVRRGGTEWRMLPSSDDDLSVMADTSTVKLRLSSATKREIAAYTTGYSTGVTIALSGFRTGGKEIDLALQFFVTLETPDDELVCRIVPVEKTAAVKECRWPGGFAPGSTDFTVVPFMQGMLLPDNWPRKVWLYDTMSWGRGLYMPWWGHMKGKSAALVILETPDDAGCVFEHPAGGPTVISPRWVHSLGKLGYPRTARMCFFDTGNYVDMAKRYRRHIIEEGRYRSLDQKIARTPDVGRLIGSPVEHTSILYHITEESSYYDKDHPEKNHVITSFDDRSKALRALAAKGVKKLYVHLDGWGYRGYDNLHPDYLPPCPEAGGWEGMKRFADTCDELGYIFALHDQYRDFYHDAPSYDPRHTIVMENGGRPFEHTWYGGNQSILCPSLAPGHVMKNHRTLKEHGVHVRGSYLDVFAVVPPEECYNPEHPITRTDCLRYRAESFSIIKNLEGVSSSEEPADWAVPYLDLVHHGPYALDPNPGKGPSMGIAVPLFNLVHHDEIILPWSMGKGDWGIPETDEGFLHALLNAGIPYLSLEPGDAELARVSHVCSLHERVGTKEMIRHEFLDGSYRRQRTTFSDGTTVTVDFDKGSFDIKPGN